MVDDFAGGVERVKLGPGRENPWARRSVSRGVGYSGLPDGEHGPRVTLSIADREEPVGGTRRSRGMFATHETRPVGHAGIL